MKIEIISNINMDSLKFYLKEYEVKSSCSYGNYMLDLLDESSALYAKEVDSIICFLDLDNLNEDLDEVLNALKNLKDKGKIVFINTLCFYPFFLDTFTNETILKEFELNKKIIEFSKNNNILLIDFNTIVKRIGYENIFASKYWYMGKIKYTAKAFKKIALEIKALFNVNTSSCKKCLVLDLDNTLWGGVIGEGEIELSNEGKGSIYQEFQKNIKALKDIGIILAINSKNNLEDALRGLNHSSSMLKKDDFIIIKANWQNKNQNLQEIASELNIGEDSLVFIDDNPVERELTKTTTNVCVPEFPKDIYALNSWFREEVIYKYFYKLKINDEDKQKQNQYKAKLNRDAVAKTMDYKEFLKTLEIKLNFLIDDKENIQRYTQLTQKTNQFNLTTKRYTIQDMEKFIEDKGYLVIGVEYSDKYAKEGIIGLCIVKKEKQEVYIDTLLLSCRVLKRDVENALIDKIISLNSSSKKIIGEYISTSKNILVKDLYTNLGFKKINETKYEKVL